MHAYRRGHHIWQGRDATVWHALPAASERALCGRSCSAYPQALFDPAHDHACVDCVKAMAATAETEAVRDV